MTVPGDPQRPPALVRVFERAIFASRWLLAPFYLSLGIALALLLAEFFRGLVHLLAGFTAFRHDEIVIAVLSLIELSLMANLVLMVMFSGYENFVSRLDVDDHADKPHWVGEIGYGDLKLKLMSSIVAISAIQLLEGFTTIEQMSDRDLAWTAGLHIVFILSAVLLALMDRISHK